MMCVVSWQLINHRTRNTHVGLFKVFLKQFRNYKHIGQQILVLFHNAINEQVNLFMVI